MSLAQSLKAAIARLEAVHVPSPRMNAEVLLMFVLGCDRAYLYGHPERELTAEEESRYDQALSQRSTGFPAQYIVGHQEFWGMDLIVTPAVLIPRPETEHVIEATLARVGQENGVGVNSVRRAPSPAESATGSVGRAPSPAESATNHVGRAPSPANPSPHMLKLVDVGTGSGCIALALAKELPNAEIHATDISPAALEVARANAARHQFDSRIQFHETDLFEGMEESVFDFVVSNPPYVGDSEEDEVWLEVRKFEPRQAVFAGPTGLEVINRLIPQAEKILKSGGWLIFEISGTISTRVEKLLSHWAEVEIINDLQGIPRVAVARKA